MTFQRQRTMQAPAFLSKCAQRVSLVRLFSRRLAGDGWLAGFRHAYFAECSSIDFRG
jgi:hypothetical protein